MIAWLALACSHPAPVAEVARLPDTPEGVFQRVRRAVEARDGAALRACFADGGPVAARLDAAESVPWEELAGALRGPQELSIEGRWEGVPVGSEVRARVHAPVAKGGGVGGLTFVLTDAGWRVLAW